MRKVYAQVPPKVEYSLSDLVKSLAPILQLMCDWVNECIDHLCKNVKDDKSPQ
ncbi:MAG: winged helix-turn-helix transcriptional regulator [Clostridium argentinense]|uniref:winged helix-turn-helix transcriptional regulator n=1 Tax=uncultured Clostridium sp. TaxID=59620 RepID=UPI002584786D|nr:winged helix-turn-helix transcriptional regulator [uncultured Clostridium sp.]MDU1349968.1 winged helix-turn-helix transcriptional regulator [Clostridium argentinense]